MIALGLDEQRCLKCQKLLFRGIIGVGFIEVKCGRCGHLNMLNSYDVMLHGTPGAYILVYDKDGRIIATSNSAEKILGYSSDDFEKMKMIDINPKFKLLPIKSDDQDGALEEWEQLHKTFPPTVKHTRKDGSAYETSARFYPIGSISGVYTVGIYYTAHI